MLELTRTVRFAVGNGDAVSEEEAWNSYAGFPSLRGFAAHCELDVSCRGEADPVTGYFLNIKEIDHAVRRRAVPVFADAAERGRAAVEALRDAFDGVDRELGGRVRRVRLRQSPTYSLTLERDHMTSVLMRQRFEFAAAHRLHVDGLSDEENRRIFGKCNNPSGHGHNYHVEPSVRVELRGGAPGFTLADLERITAQTLIDHLDHKHLNRDVPEFAELNPSVENIARVCYERLAPAIHAGGAELDSVTVWETEKTSCVYPA